jgi:hypothetical protein
MSDPILQEDSSHYQVPRDYTRDPAFVQAAPADKHKYLMAMDPAYAKDTPQNQQAFLKSMAPNNPSGHSMGQDTTVPIQSESGRMYQGTPTEAKLRDWSGPVAKVLASVLAARGLGGLTEAAGGGGAAQATARAAGAGGVTGATEPGSMGDKARAAGTGALWSLGGEGAVRVGNAIATAPSVGRFGSRMLAQPATPAVPPSNPITSATVLHDMGSGQPAGSPFAPRPILGPNGQAVSAVQAPAVENQLRQVSPQTPIPTGPAKDFLVTRTPSSGTPAIPENMLSKILKSGIPAGVSQNPSVQAGIGLGGIGIYDWLKEMGRKLGIGRDAAQIGGG